MRNPRIAVVGASGAVGEVMLSILAERGHSGQPGDGPGQRALGGRAGRLWQQAAGHRGSRRFRFQQHRLRAVLGGWLGQQGTRAAGGRSRRHRDRQHLRFPLRRRHSAGGARGQCARRWRTSPPAPSSPTRTVPPSRWWWPWRRYTARPAFRESTWPPTSRSRAPAGAACTSWPRRPRQRLNFQEIEVEQVRPADRVQRAAPDRRDAGQRLHPRRNENALGNPQDFRGSARSW